MKKQLILLSLFLISFSGFAQLTDDQKTSIGSNPNFQNRIATVLREKALYWQNYPTGTRALVNRQIQKRKRLAKTILTTSYADNSKDLIGQYWIIQYSGNDSLDGNGVPTSTTIGNAFDPTFDYWAGYINGDENLTEIDW